MPMSSPMMTTMFGRCPAGAGDGVACCACAESVSPTAASAEAATRELPLNNRSRRFIPLPDCGVASRELPDGSLLLMTCSSLLQCNWSCSLDASKADIACGDADQPGTGPYQLSVCLLLP